MFLPLFDIDEEYGYQQRKISSLFTPVMTIVIILCAIIFVYKEFFVKDVSAFYQKWGTSAYKLLSEEKGIMSYLSLITYAFLHSNIWHILGNLWFFFIFGNNVERKMGTIMFVLFYFSASAVAALVHMFVLHPEAMLGQAKISSFSQLRELNVPLVGASGAISAVLGAYLRYFPRNYVATLVLFFIITVIPVSASIFIGIWLAGQIINALINTEANIAWFAHIGGFLYGYLFAMVYGGRNIVRYYE
ncbi:MAG: rhomboid family intramembrane serine protease [Brevinematia bacterium]